MHGEVTSKLFDVLNKLAINRDLIDKDDYIRYIRSLLNTGADPNVRGQDGKTLLHYVAERNNIEGYNFLLKAGSNPYLQDQSGKIPWQYVTENECLQAIQQTPFSNNDPGYGSDDDNQTIPELNDLHKDKQESPGSDIYEGLYDMEDCGIRYSDLDFYDESENLIRKKGSFSLTKVKLNDAEKKKYEGVWQEMRKIINLSDKVGECEEDYIESLKEKLDEVISQALKQGIMFAFPYENDESFVDLIIDAIQKLYWVDSSENSRLLKEKKILQIISGGAALNELTKENYEDYVNYIYREKDVLSQRKEGIQELSNLAYGSIVSENKQAHQCDFKAEIDNGYFCIEYPQDSTIQPAKILNSEKAEGLNLRVGILKIGESIVRVEKEKDGKRNYQDILEGSVKMSFTTEVGKISIYLSPNEEDSNKIKVRIDEESITKFNKLKDKSGLGANCLLKGQSISEAIGEYLDRYGNVSTKLTDTQTRLLQEEEVTLGSKRF